MYVHSLYVLLGLCSLMMGILGSVWILWDWLREHRTLRERQTRARLRNILPFCDSAGSVKDTERPHRLLTTGNLCTNIKIAVSEIPGVRNFTSVQGALSPFLQ